MPTIDRALKAAGAGREDVVEIAIYIVDLEKVDPNPVYEDVRNFFPAGHKPASMVIGVSALAYPGLLVEVNVRAVGITRTSPDRSPITGMGPRFVG